MRTASGDQVGEEHADVRERLGDARADALGDVRRRSRVRADVEDEQDEQDPADDFFHRCPLWPPFASWHETATIPGILREPPGVATPGSPAILELWLPLCPFRTALRQPQLQDRGGLGRN